VSRVLVTGGTGFVGEDAVGLLTAAGWEVHVVTRQSETATTEPGVVMHRADLLADGEPEALIARIDPTHLLHLAWYAVPGAFWSSPENVRWLEASLRLARAFAAAGGKRAVLAGTCAEYDWSKGLCSESSTPLRPATLYGACKHALQSSLAAWAQVVGIELAWGRIFFLYGPREDPARLVPAVTRALLAGEPADCSSGTQVRDFLFSRDVAAAFVALLTSDVVGPVNIGSGVPISVGEVVAEVARAVGRPELVRLGALPTRPDEPALLVADVSRLQKEVGWTPSVSLEEGIERTVAWWRERSMGS
jgi:nucleoside-diphosphate-sugar epimerase